MRLLGTDFQKLCMARTDVDSICMHSKLQAQSQQLTIQLLIGPFANANAANMLLIIVPCHRWCVAIYLWVGMVLALLAEVVIRS